MPARVVVVGGSIAGLAAAVGLARRGWSVTVVERDVGPTTDRGDEAFLSWERRSVPQFRFGHLFSARSRNLLDAHVPEVLERLEADGIRAGNPLELMAPPELWEPGDERFVGLRCRRPGFELALRRTAEAEPGVELACPASVAGLRFASSDARPVRVTGVRLADGRVLDADVVLDCGGRRSPARRWLHEAGVEIPQRVQDCGVTYFSRYFRQRRDSTLDRSALFGLRGELERLLFLGFIGDRGTFGVVFITLPHDDELEPLRHNLPWETLAASIPAIAPWVDARNAAPLHDVQVMSGHQNVRREYAVDGAPLALGLLTVGDSLCATNPTYGWGASMALTYAFAAVDALTGSDGGLTAMALAYDAAVRPEADDVYRESAAMDRSWIYRMIGQEVPPEDREEMERQDLIREGVVPGAAHDLVLGRALLKRMNLIDAPGAILDDPEVVTRARRVRERVASKPSPKLGPDRDEMRTILSGVDRT